MSEENEPSPIRAWSLEEIQERDHDEVVNQSDRLTAALKPILFGKHPAVQFLSLLDCVAIWLSGYDEPEVRDAMLEAFCVALRRLHFKSEDKLS